MERNEHLLLFLALDAYGGWACSNDVLLLGNPFPDLSDVGAVVATSVTESRSRIVDAHVVGGVAGHPLWAKAMRLSEHGQSNSSLHVALSIAASSESPQLMETRRCCPFPSWMQVRLDGA